MESHAAEKEREARRDDANRALEEVIDAQSFICKSIVARH